MLKIVYPFSNWLTCDLCGVSTNNEHNYSAHIQGRKHNIRKFLSKLDYTKFHAGCGASSSRDLVSEHFLHEFCENRFNLCAYGIENFVEFAEGNNLHLFSTASGEEFILPLYQAKGADEEGEDEGPEEGEISQEKKSGQQRAKEAMPQAYFDFVDTIQMNYHLAHSLRDLFRCLY